MRIIELLLIALLSIHLILLLRNLKGHSHRLILMLISTVVVISHLFVEGYRWQMIPAYALMVCYLISFLLPRSSYRKIGWVLMTLLLVISIFLPTALPVLVFKNDGEFKVGVQESNIQSEREEVLTRDSLDRREYPIRVFYPAEGPKEGRVDYISQFDKVKPFYAKKIGWPAFLIDYLRYISIEGEKGAEPIAEKFPLVIYSHGLTNNYTEATGRLMKIASRGYVVVAINHTYSSDFSVLSNGEVATYKALSMLGDPLDKVDSVKTIIANQWVEDVKETIAYLKSAPLAKNVDFSRIGLLGFSAGGTMATLGSFQVPNVKVAINLDGTPRGIPEAVSSNCSHLFLFSEPTHYSDAQLAAWGIKRSMVEDPINLKLNRALKIIENTSGASFAGVIKQTEHSNFIEFPLLSPYSKQLGIGGSIDSEQCYEIINELIYNFLDRSLKGIDRDLPVAPEIENDIRSFISS